MQIIKVTILDGKRKTPFNLSYITIISYMIVK
jgi:hypothetical protein